jgi:hypothetical protein
MAGINMARRLALAKENGKLSLSCNPCMSHWNLLVQQKWLLSYQSCFATATKGENKEARTLHPCISSFAMNFQVLSF